MAKLSARGRTELARMSRISAVNRDNIVEERIEVVFASDGNQLLKRTIRYSPDADKQIAGTTHNWGWNLAGKFKPAELDKATARLAEKGFRKV